MTYNQHIHSNWSVIYQSLNNHSKLGNQPEYVIEIIEKIIKDRLKKNDNPKGIYFRYLNLMKIPFHFVPMWVESSLENIRKWETRPRNLVTHTILAYRTKPSAIKYMCKAILVFIPVKVSHPFR